MVYDVLMDEIKIMIYCNKLLFVFIYVGRKESIVIYLYVFEGF